MHPASTRLKFHPRVDSWMQRALSRDVESSMQPRFENEHWRKRAKRMRSLAAEVPSPQQRILITDLAEEYERRATEAALRARLGSSLKSSAGVDSCTQPASGRVVGEAGRG
jgi:hypothetical protein